MSVNNEATASATSVAIDDPTFPIDVTGDTAGTLEIGGTDDEQIPSGDTGTNDTNNSGDDHGDTSTFMKDIFHSLPAMEQKELEKIVQQTSQLWTNDDDDDMNNKERSSLWNANVIEPFWMEYQTRKCRHLAAETTSKQHKRGDDSEEHITNLRQQIQDYQTSQYSEKPNVVASFQVTAAAVVTTSLTNPTTEIMVRTYAEFIDTANCSTARWEVVWTIQIVDDITATLSGTILLHTHYYENNINSQMQCQQEVVHNHTISLQEENVNSLVAKFEKNTLSYAEKLVTKIVQYIIRAEEEYFTTIVDQLLCNDSHVVADDDNTMIIPIHDQLRSLRRILPITKHKFQWNHQNQTQQKNRMVQQQHQQMMMMRTQQPQQKNRRNHNNDPTK